MHRPRPNAGTGIPEATEPGSGSREQGDFRVGTESDSAYCAVFVTKNSHELDVSIDGINE